MIAKTALIPAPSKYPTEPVTGRSVWSVRMVCTARLLVSLSGLTSIGSRCRSGSRPIGVAPSSLRGVAGGAGRAGARPADLEEDFRLLRAGSKTSAATLNRFIDDHRVWFGDTSICDVLGLNASALFTHSRLVSPPTRSCGTSTASGRPGACGTRPTTSWVTARSTPAHPDRVRDRHRLQPPQRSCMTRTTRSPPGWRSRPARWCKSG